MEDGEKQFSDTEGMSPVKYNFDILIVDIRLQNWNNCNSKNYL